MIDLHNNLDLEIVIGHVLRPVLYHFMYLLALAVALLYPVCLEVLSVLPEEGTCWLCLSSCPAGLALKGGFRVTFYDRYVGGFVFVF